MKKLFIILLIAVSQHGFSQMVGIGKGLTPGRSVMEVIANKTDTGTIGFFGDQQGISLSWPWSTHPAIGFNRYQNKTSGTYMGNGYAAEMSYNYISANGGLLINMHPSGLAGQWIPSNKVVFKLGADGAGINSAGSLPSPALFVERGTGAWGTAAFEGTNYISHINYLTEEDTYIRSGKNGSSVLIADTEGDINIGSGSSAIGINYNNPVYTLEIRQTGGRGMRMRDLNNANWWEWRVSGSPANYWAYFNGSVKAYFRASDGALFGLSDRRLKEDIRPLSTVLQKINRLNPVTYEMLDNNPHHIRSTGFIAQEVQSLFPEVVYTDSTADQNKAINYGAFGAIAVKGVQEENVLINELEKQSEAIQQKLMAIEKMLKDKKIIKQ